MVKMLVAQGYQVASGRREAISFFGQDYEARDGSCVRNYIHIVDLYTAHLLANSALARSELGWSPQYADLTDIVEHAWNWEISHFK